MILGFPLFILIAIIIKLQERGPLFYKGIRLGQNKTTFFIYKFRTLPVGAEDKIGAKLLAPTDFKLPWFSKFLRDTRLDELPQLWNVLKGDMDFIGPRPLRPQIYEKYCKHIPNFDLRFEVKPGLIGLSQLFTPHRTPKRIRALIDNYFIKQKRSCVFYFFIIFITILAVIYKSMRMLFIGIYRYVIYGKLLNKFEEKRRWERVRQTSTFLEICNDQYVQESVKFLVYDINEEYFKIIIDFDDQIYPQLKSAEHGKLVVIINGLGRKKKKTALVRIKLSNEYILTIKGQSKKALIFKYEPQSEFYRYIVEMYILKKALINYWSLP